MGEKRNARMLLMGKPELKRPLGRLGCRWMDTINMDLGKIVWGYVDWIDLARVRDQWGVIVSVVMNLRVPYYAENF
jgi:hypothetical protein